MIIKIGNRVDCTGQLIGNGQRGEPRMIHTGPEIGSDRRRGRFKGKALAVAQMCVRARCVCQALCSVCELLSLDEPREVGGSRVSI